MFRERGVEIKTPEQIALMREAGLVVGETLALTRDAVAPGLTTGDVVSIDCGAIVQGWHGDAAVTVAVGEVPDDVRDLIRVTEEAMWRGIAAAALGGRVTDISAAIEAHVRRHGDY